MSVSVKDKEKLTEKQIAILNNELDKNKKSTGLTYVLFIFFGSLGIHKFYIGNKKMGLIYLFLGIVGWISLLSGGMSAVVSEGDSGSGAAIFGLICFIVLGVLCLIDLFTIPKQVRKRYDEIEESTINSLLDN